MLTIFELMVICAVLFASASVTGVIGSVLLALIALALLAKRGLLAILLLTASFFVAEWSWNVTSGNTQAVRPNSDLNRPFFVLLYGVVLCVWFRLRCLWHQRQRHSHPTSGG